MDNRDDMNKDADEKRLDELLEQAQPESDRDEPETKPNEIDKSDTPDARPAKADVAHEPTVETPAPATSITDTATSRPIFSEPATDLETKKVAFKKYFLYTLVGGLIACALISVVAVLVGEFNEAMTKALSTTLTMVAHTIALLFLISNTTKRSNALIVNVLIGITTLSFMTSLLGIWGIMQGQIIGDLYLLYFYTFCLSLWVQLLLFVGENLIDKLTRITSRVAIGFSGLFYVLLLPTVFVHYPSTLPEFLFRSIAATAIVLATASVLCAVFRRIYIAKNHVKGADPSLHAGVDIAIALIALFIGIPVIFAMIASISYNQQSKSYESSYESSPSPSVSPEPATTYNVSDCTDQPAYSGKQWQMSKYVYYYQGMDTGKGALKLSEEVFSDPIASKPYDDSLVVVDAECNPYSFEDINTGDPVTYYTLKSQAGRINETILMLQAADERDSSSGDSNRSSAPFNTST